jgi:NADH-quinone oxidoreductase subunit H
MWIRYTLPRIRIDHMLNFNWKFLTPLALVVLVVTAIMDKLLVNVSGIGYTVIMLFVNIVIAWVTLIILRTYASREREKIGEPKPVANVDVTIPVSGGGNPSTSSSG